MMHNVDFVQSFLQFVFLVFMNVFHFQRRHDHPSPGSTTAPAATRTTPGGIGRPRTRSASASSTSRVTAAVCLTQPCVCVCVLHNLQVLLANVKYLKESSTFQEMNSLQKTLT